MAFYILIGTNKLLFKLDDKNSTIIGLMDTDETTAVNYNDTHLFNFFVIRKQLEGDGPVPLGPEMEQYIHVSFRQ